MIKISSNVFSRLSVDTDLAVFVYENSKTIRVNPLYGALFSNAYDAVKRDGFSGKAGQVRVIHSKKRRLFYVGLGKENKGTLESIRRGTAALVRKAAVLKSNKLALRAPLIGNIPLSAQAAVEGAILGSHTDNRFKSKTKETKPLTLTLISKNASDQKQLQAGIKQGEVYATSTLLVRDLVNTPPSSLYPDLLAKEASKAAKGRVKIKIFKKAQIEKMKMGALLGVNRGSWKDPVFIHLTYKPRGRARKKIGICGKGITFDSGGLSLKPPRAMETMKLDMAGAAVVIGVFKAISQLNPNVEVHGFAPITENMPGGNALKPGDVLKSMNGKTIEVLNTDAEGRLVLSDALHYACKQNVDELVDLATLTGACVVALGLDITAVMSTSAKLTSKIKTAASLAGEKMWELPLEEEYESHIKSNVADVKNMGRPMQAGTIIGGLFLKEFVNPKIPWAHLDIAGSGWAETPTALSPIGGTGAMVRTLLNYIQAN